MAEYSMMWRKHDESGLTLLNDKSGKYRALYQNHFAVDDCRFLPCPTFVISVQSCDSRV